MTHIPHPDYWPEGWGVELCTLWRAEKDGRTRRCIARTHPLGIDVTILVTEATGEELLQSRVFRIPAEALAAAADYRRELEARSWMPIVP